MLDEVSEHIEKIRSKVRAERDVISRLNTRVRDVYLKKQIKSASNLLDDVENFFLNTEILKEQRSIGQWTYWLRGAETVLQHAVHLREDVTEIVARFGENARSFQT